MFFTIADVNSERIQQQLQTLAQIGGQPTGGVTRLTFSSEHLQATHLVGAWMTAAGLDVAFDRWGNLLGCTADEGGMVLSGSHLDSVPNGGNYDGVLGVLSALEAVTLILERGIELKKSLGVVSFIEEEGARFHGLMGSKLAVDNMERSGIDAIKDKDGLKYIDVLKAVEFGYPVRDFQWKDDVKTFLELHIEQGKRLEQAGIPIGVVTSIAGPTFMRVRLIGQADHAGATEYADRRDSLLAAAEIIVAIRELAVREFPGRGHMTVGKIEAQPNVTNVIAGVTEFNIDYRAADNEAYQQMSQHIGEILESVATKHQIQVDSQIMHHTDAEVSKPHIRQAYEQGAQAAGVASQPLVSWAAHDAMNMAKIANSGMMFVPCRDGRSHTPEEYVKPEDVATGVAVLANAMFQLAT